MKEILKIRCHIYILMKKVIILRKVLVTMKSVPGSSLFYNTSARHKRHKSNTRATWTTRVLHKRHECDTSVTRVKNFDFDDDTSHNIFSHPYITSRILNSLAGCVTELCASYFYWFFFFHFGFLWYSSFVINFPRFLKRLFRPMRISCLGISRAIIKFDYVN